MKWKMSRLLLAKRFLSLYPGAFRQRYEQEILMLLEEHTISHTTLFDLLFGALDAQLHSANKKERILFMFRNMRVTALTFACAFIMYMLGTISLNILPQMLPEHGRGSTLWLFGAIAESLSISLLLCLVLLFAFSLLRAQLKARNKDAFFLAGICLIAIPVWPWIVFLFEYLLIPPAYPDFWRYLAMDLQLFYAPALLNSALLWSSVFVMIYTLKELLGQQRKPLVAFTIAAYMIIPVLLASFLFNTSISLYTGEGFSSLTFWLVSFLGNISGKLPAFLSIGVLAVAMCKQKTKRSLSLAGFCVAAILTLMMLVQTSSALLALSTWSSLGKVILQPMGIFLSLNCFYMVVAILLACVALIRWFVLLKTTPSPFQTTQH